MENCAAQQLTSLATAAVFGLLAGFLYDLLRAVRLRRRYTPWLTHLLDVFFVLFLSAIGLYLTFQTGQGELRLFLVFGVAGGALLWFSLLSSFFRPLWDWWLDTALTFFRTLWKPVSRLLHLFGKMRQRTKKGFLFLKRYVTMGLPRWRVLWFHRPGKEDRKMAKTKTKKRRVNPIFLLILLLLIVLVLVQIVQVYTKYDALKAEEAALTEQADSLQQENDALRSDLAKKNDPAFWEQLARRFADMVKKGERIFIDPNY